MKKWCGRVTALEGEGEGCMLYVVCCKDGDSVILLVLFFCSFRFLSFEIFFLFGYGFLVRSRSRGVRAEERRGGIH